MLSRPVYSHTIYTTYFIFSIFGGRRKNNDYYGNKIKKGGI